MSPVPAPFLPGLSLLGQNWVGKVTKSKPWASPWGHQPSKQMFTL